MRLKNAIAALALACCTFGTVVPAVAQEAPKADWFFGYSFIKPDATGYSPRLKQGAGTTVTYNFSQHVGLSIDLGFGRKDQPSANLNFQNTTLMAGPKFTWRGEHAMPFLEAMAGVGHTTNSPQDYHSTKGAAMFGGGLDVKVWKAFGFRIFRLDEVIQQQQDGTDAGYRFQTGVLLMSSTGPKLIPAAACSVAPTEVLAGEPITATANASQFNPKHNVTYAWTSTGGKTSGTSTTTQIDTTGLAPGSYKVSAHVADEKSAKATADCSANFTIKEPPKHPPTISCSANPSTVTAPQSATISCTTTNPDNRPLTYAWQSNPGTVAGNNENGTLATEGLNGPVTITTTVTDDRGLTANTTTSVTVQAPPPPPPPPPVNQVKQDLDTKGKALLDVHFDVDKSTIRPESEKILTDSASVLKEEPDLAVFVDGYTDSTGTKAHNLVLSRHRAAAVKSWLEEHGIEGSRLVSRGFGESNPVGDNKTTEGKQANRRVELVKMTDAEKAKAAKAAAAPKAHHKAGTKKSTTTTTTTTTTTKKK